MNPDGTTAPGGFLGLLNSAINSAATGYGAALGLSNPIGGSRLPSTPINPLAINQGVPGQDNTKPNVAAAVAASTWVPGVSNGVVLAGAGALAVGLIVLLVSRK